MTETKSENWRPPITVVLLALFALVLGVAMIVFVGLEFKPYWTSFARILMLIWLSLIWFVGFLGALFLVRLFFRRA